MIYKEELIKAGLKAVYTREQGVGITAYTVEQLKEMLPQEKADWGRRKGLGLDIVGQL